MKFSIIIPVYNAEKYFHKCVNSILSQTYTNFELILVDDASPDKCGFMCDEFAQKDSRITVIHKENGGAASARNVGIKAAKGDYLLFVDSDDYWICDNVLEKVCSHLEKYNSVMAQFGFYKQFSDDSEPILCGNRSFDNDSILSENIYLSSPVAARKISPSACGTVVLRRFVVDNKLYFPEGIKCEDIEWAFNLFVLKPKSTFMNDSFYVYRFNREGSVTNTIDNRHLTQYCDILERSVSLIESKKDASLDAVMSYAMQQIILATAHNQRVTQTKEQKKEIHNRLKQLAKGRFTRYTLDKRVKTMLPIYKTLGFDVMSFVLGIYLRHQLDK